MNSSSRDLVTLNALVFEWDGLERLKLQLFSPPHNSSPSSAVNTGPPAGFREQLRPHRHTVTSDPKGHERIRRSSSRFLHCLWSGRELQRPINTSNTPLMPSLWHLLLRRDKSERQIFVCVTMWPEDRTTLIYEENKHGVAGRSQMCWIY